MIPKSAVVFLVGIVCAFVAGCSSDGTPAVFSPTIEDIIVEVDYESGAEPYTGEGRTGNDLWVLFETNAAALLEDSEATLTVPHELGEMDDIGEIDDASFDTDEILNLAAEHRDTQDSPTQQSYYVLFLDAFYFSDGEPQRSVLGVSIGDTGVIAMFKPVIASSLLVVARFVEQTTLIHEFGHAIGLVNNGIALQSDHHDAEHGAHCTNRDCVMYYLNEGIEDLAQFVQDVVINDDVIVFGDECLADTRAASGT